MIQEKISSEVTEIERQDEKQEIEQQIAMSSKGGSDTNGSSR